MSVDLGSVDLGWETAELGRVELMRDIQTGGIPCKPDCMEEEKDWRM